MNIWAICYGLMSAVATFAVALILLGKWHPDADDVAATAFVAFQLGNLALYLLHSRNLVRAR